METLDRDENVPNRFGEKDIHPSEGRSNAVPWSKDPRSESFMEKSEARSDSQILSDLREHLSEAQNLDSSRLHLFVKEGRVSLSGFVSSEDEKWEVENLATGTLGVSDVENSLIIQSLAQENDPKAPVKGFR